MKTNELDQIFDDNAEDVLHHFDIDNAVRPNRHKRVNVDFPEWIVQSLDTKAQHLGVSRQALIKLWIADKLSENRP